MYDLIFDILVELKQILEELRRINKKLDGGNSNG